MNVKIENHKRTDNININTKCPHCGHYGSFEPILEDFYTYNGPNNINKYFGIRKCPNINCRGHLFFIADSHHNLIIKYPNEVIPFDKSNIPKRVIDAFEEAIKCHSSNCFIASAIMIRKTLEEICLERNAKGSNLLIKLNILSEKIMIPKELIEGMNELRLLGNDAAHIEAKTFSEIGINEIEISLEFTKEILKAVYQYESLLNKLKSLKTEGKSNNL